MKDVDSDENDESDVTKKKDGESGLIKIVESEKNIIDRYKRKKKKKMKRNIINI